MIALYPLILFTFIVVKGAKDSPTKSLCESLPDGSPFYFYHEDRCVFIPDLSGGRDEVFDHCEKTLDPERDSLARVQMFWPDTSELLAFLEGQSSFPSSTLFYIDGTFDPTIGGPRTEIASYRLGRSDELASILRLMAGNIQLQEEVPGGDCLVLDVAASLVRTASCSTNRQALCQVVPRAIFAEKNPMEQYSMLFRCGTGTAPSYYPNHAEVEGSPMQTGGSHASCAELCLDSKKCRSFLFDPQGSDDCHLYIAPLPVFKTSSCPGCTFCTVY